MSIAVRALPHFDSAFKGDLDPYIRKYKAEMDGLAKQNRYGVPIGTGGWAGNEGVISYIPGERGERSPGEVRQRLHAVVRLSGIPGFSAAWNRVTMMFDRVSRWRNDMHQAMTRLAAVILAIALAVLTGSAAAQTPAKVDVTGGWAFEVQTEAGAGTPQVTFKQDGEKLTGHYSSTVLGEADLTGSVKGQAIEFSLTASVQGNSIELTFVGTIEDNNSMKGKVSFGGFGEGTFTGKRK